MLRQQRRRQHLQDECSQAAATSMAVTTMDRNLQLIRPIRLLLVVYRERRLCHNPVTQCLLIPLTCSLLVNRYEIPSCTAVLTEAYAAAHASLSLATPSPNLIGLPKRTYMRAGTVGATRGGMKVWSRSGASELPVRADGATAETSRQRGPAVGLT